ncbi:UTRA domain-containing protein [Streptomyces mirabilis]|nr:UTRA domain-containing protein [Streptomyces sp. RLB1-33]QUW78379.1 UTRA domain-containing protein [Streptomyces mirabilis]
MADAETPAGRESRCWPAAAVKSSADIAARRGIAEGYPCARTTYEFLADGRLVHLSTSWDAYDITADTPIVLPEGGPHAGAGVVNRMAAIGVTDSHAVEQPEPRQATAEDASLLGIQKAALVTHTRRTCCVDGIRLWFSVVVRPTG